MNSAAVAVAAAAGMGGRSHFTPAQWQELEHQALIYKYLMAGVPVPPELLIPIQRSFEALAGRYYPYPALGYCSYYGKKLDPEPGRCRRTDGKKWRCSKDAHPDSKYCERHMHRGRNRSRKPVESQSVSQLKSPSSPATSLAPIGSGGGGSKRGDFQSIPQQPMEGHSNRQSLNIGVSRSLQLPMNPGVIGNRYFSGVKPGLDEHTFFSATSGNAKDLRMDSVNSSWHLMPSRVSSFPLSKVSDPSPLQGAHSHLRSVQDLGLITMNSISRRQQQQQQSFTGGEFDLPEPVKHEGQYLRPFFDEWPKTRDSWSDLEEDRSNRASFSTTQLSMSFPMTSDFSTSSSKSPNSESIPESSH
ncbi:hypothetical protein Cni_G27083 [Canna indica]|uniref:Growth-regulating factor n=1 Tax=Canna indica TaxID=4628 RepID=A0AAQ3L0Z4_9LILI|nr:hypothetical protein Cni_G27083 [Canna indica]